MSSLVHLLYWGALALEFLAVDFLISNFPIPFTEGLEGLVFIGLFFLHLAAGHLFGYTPILKRAYHAVPWRRAYQRCLALSFAVTAAGWIAGALLPKGVGIYAVVLSMAAGLLYSNHCLGQFQDQDRP